MAFALAEQEDLVSLATRMKLALVVCVDNGGKSVEREGRQGLQIYKLTISL